MVLQVIGRRTSRILPQLLVVARWLHVSTHGYDTVPNTPSSVRRAGCSDAQNRVRWERYVASVVGVTSLCMSVRNQETASPSGKSGRFTRRSRYLVVKDREPKVPLSPGPHWPRQSLRSLLLHAAAVDACVPPR